MAVNDTMVKLTKDKFAPFIQTGTDPTTHDPVWARIKLSTTYEITMNEEEEDKDYICYENPVTEIKSNKPEIPLENELYEGDAGYDFLANHFISLPIGAACKVNFLQCFGGTAKKAWLSEATITSKAMQIADGKIAFTLKLGGDIQKGTWTIDSSTGQPEFTPDSSNEGDNVKSAEKKGK